MKIVLPAVTIAFALALTACQEAKRPEPIRPVLSMIIEPMKSNGAQIVGTVQPRYQTTLGARTLGRLVARPVNVGDLVTEGQVVAAIDATALRLAVQSAKADHSKALGLLANASGIEARKQILIRTDATTRQTLDNAELMRAAAQASAARARANLEKAIEQLSYAQIKSEFAGVVTAVGAEVGQVIAPGQGIVTVARSDIREAVVDIGADFPQPLKIGLQFTVRSQTLPTLQVQGKIREISPQADSVTRMNRVRISLTDPPDNFRLGSMITAEPDISVGSALRIPSSAVLTRDGQTFVWIVDPLTNTVSLQQADLENDKGGQLIKSGISAGTRIVTAGINSLKPGQQVRLEKDLLQ